VRLTLYFHFWHWLIQINKKMKLKINGLLTLVLALVVQIGFAQTKTVTGTVTDQDGLPLPGVNILIKGENSGTQTDFDGNYSVTASSDQTLIFRYVGFKTQNIKIGNKSLIDVRLSIESGELDEVVVTAYSGILKDSEITSAVSTVKGEAIEQVPIASLDQLLQGNVAGANVRVGSGQPGQAGQIIIRGRTSINGSTDPLYVVDGVPVDADNFRNINTNDISGISVLKDAAGTAIYGNRGAAGVIVVTTKGGKRNSALKVQYRSLFGESVLPESNVEVMNSRQFLNYQRNLLPGNQFGDGLSQEESDLLAAQNNTNWADIILRKGRTESHQLTLTSGGENLSSYTSMQYFEQEGTTLRSKLQRFSLRNNIEGGSDNFTYSNNINVSYSKNDFIVDATRGTNTGGQLDNAFIVPFLGLPYLNPLNADGSLNTFGTRRSGALNPDGSVNVQGANGFQNTPFLALNTAAENTDRENELRIITNTRLNYKISDNFSVGGSTGVSYSHIQSLSIDAPNSIRGLLSPNQNAASEVFGGTQFESSFRDFTSNTNVNITYNQTFNDKHKLNAAFFGEYFYRNVQNSGFQSFGLNPKFPGSSAGFVEGGTLIFGDPDNPTLDNLSVPFVPNTFSTENEISLASVFTNIDYSYDDKYGINVVVRRDGTSRFQEDVRWGTFGSVGVRWNIDKEDFMDNVEWIESLKLRGSWGVTGNQDVGGFYRGFQQIGGGNGYQGNPQLVTGTFTDETVTWETTTQTNIGVDFGLFNNRLTGALDVYEKVTDDLFFNKNLSAAATGFSSVLTNVGEMSNTGIETQLSYDLIRSTDTKGFSLNVYGNISYNKNEIVNLDNETGFIEAGSGARLQEGLPAFTYFDQRWAGVDPASGRPLYLDAEGDLTTVYDREQNGVYLDGKQFDPVWTGGFGTNISWNNFTLNSLFSFAADTWRKNGTLAIMEDASLGGFSNQSVTMLDAWTTPGQQTGTPSLAFGGIRFQSGDRYLEDASFLRLRNVTLAYNFDQDILEKTKVFSAIRLYLQGTNLITWSKWRGYDPETTELNEFFNFPTPRVYTVGVDLTF
jgi:TonB-linked SusC/RagA family outer membrane protein